MQREEDLREILLVEESLRDFDHHIFQFIASPQLDPVVLEVCESAHKRRPFVAIVEGMASSNGDGIHGGNLSSTSPMPVN